MVHHHASIARQMHGVAIVAFPIAALASVVNGRPILGLDYCLDTGLMASVAVLIALSPAAVIRGRSRPFALGFVAAGWTAVIAYVGSCALFPDVVALPVLYYINRIEPRLMDADSLASYSAGLVVRGLIVAAPRFILGLSGGLLAKLVARRRASGGSAVGPTTGVAS
jgi:hypothetical protein